MAIQDRFLCQIDHCNMWDKEDHITNEMCGCTYSRECFEGLFRTQVRDRVLEWDFNHAGVFQCRSNLHERPILKGTCEIGDMVQNQEYSPLWQRYKRDTNQSFNDLVPGCKAPFTALVPEYLRAVYQAKLADDKKPAEARNCFDNWNAQVKGSQERVPAYQEEWGVCTQTIFLARCLYHVAVAVIFELVLFPVSFVVSKETYGEWREGDIGDRITELYMQYYGCEYDYSRPKTLENRLIRWMCGE